MGCGREKARGCERCRRHLGLPNFQIWARGRRGGEGSRASRPALIFQGSDDSDLATFLSLDGGAVIFVDRWAARVDDPGSYSHSSHDVADLMIRPGSVRPGCYSSLPLSDPSSVDQIELNDVDELDLLTRQGRLRSDMTPWRRAVVAKLAKESNQRTRGMQVHMTTEDEQSTELKTRHTELKTRHTSPRVIERHHLDR